MRLRIFLLTLLSVFIFMPVSFAQKLEVGAVVGYRTGGDFRFDQVLPGGQLSSTHFNTDSGPDISIQIDAPIQEYASAELIFDYMNTTVNSSNPLSELQSVGLKIYTIHLGGIYTTSTAKIRPILGGSMGITVFNPDNGTGSTTRFSFGFTGGGKAYISDSFGLRAQTRIVMALVQSADFFCGPEPGSCFTAGGSMFTQIDFGLGVFIMI